MLTNPLRHNQNRNLRTHDPHYASGRDQIPLEANTSHSCINMVRVTKVVTHAKYYGSSQPDLGKEPTPTESPLHIENPMDKPDIAPCYPKGVLKSSGHNPNT